MRQKPRLVSGAMCYVARLFNKKRGMREKPRLVVGAMPKIYSEQSRRHQISRQFSPQKQKIRKKTVKPPVNGGYVTFDPNPYPAVAVIG